ncbi:MAG: 6-pyruvoyltetrahydropterin/6-carboxytetrahydropterin synthase [Acidimicrobiaceae bacterium]
MATTTIWKRFSLECAHSLPNVPADHKCARLHGHSFQVAVHVAGEPGATSGWVMDFADITSAWQPVHDALDHRCLNDVAGLENPTSEVLAAWIWHRLVGALPSLCEVVVEETCTSGCRYRG